MAVGDDDEGKRGVDMEDLGTAELLTLMAKGVPVKGEGEGEGARPAGAGGEPEAGAG